MTLLDHLPSLHHAAKPRIDRAIWPSTACVDDLGRLSVGDVPLTDIADEFRTPTYVIDELDFRRRLMHYRTTLRGAETVYAGKSLLTTTIARWAAEEGAGIDVSSVGELTTALAAGVDPSRIIMHGNAKPPDELNDAVTAGIGRVVVDSLMEIAYLEGDWAGAEKEARWFPGRQEEYAGLGTQAANEDALGRRERARALYRRAAEMARRSASRAVGRP